MAKKILILNLLLILFHAVAQQTQEEQSQLVAPLLSLIVPGGGQFYNKNYWKSGFFAISEVALCTGIIYHYKLVNKYNNKLSKSKLSDLDRRHYKFYRNSARRYRNNYTWGLVGTILIAMGDAFVESKFINFNRNIFQKGDELDFEYKDNAITLTYRF